MNEKLKQQFLEGQISVKLVCVEDKEWMISEFPELVLSNKSFDSFYPYATVQCCGTGEKRLTCFTGPKNKIFFESVEEFQTADYTEPKTFEIEVKNCKSDGQSMNIHKNDEFVYFGIYKIEVGNFNEFIKEFNMSVAEK